MMTEETTQDKIVFNVPSRQAPGFVRRQKRMLELMKLRKSFSNIPADPSDDQLQALSDGFSKIVDFLADYVVAESREKALMLLEDASEEQFDQMFDALGGASNQVPPVKASKPKSANSGKRVKATSRR